MARLIVSIGESDERVIELKEGLNSIGRSPENDFQIDHPSISSAHCVISQNGGKLMIKDLGSTNGTYVGREKIKDAVIDRSRDLWLGNEVKLRVEPEPDLPEISIPEMKKPEAPAPRFAEDGTPLCHVSPGQAADMRCSQCGHFFAWENVNHLGLQGREQHHYCPECGGECQPIVQPDISAKAKLRNAFNNFMKALYSNKKSKE